MDICPIVDRPPLLNGVFPIIMSCIARKTLLLCFRWMLTVYISFIFIGNILAVVFTQLKNHPQYKKKYYFSIGISMAIEISTNTLASRYCLWLLQFTKFRLMLVPCSTYWKLNLCKKNSTWNCYVLYIKYTNIKEFNQIK